MIFVFKVFKINNNYQIHSIRKLKSSDFFLFKKEDQILDKHIEAVKSAIKKTDSVDHRQININITDPFDVLKYFDPIKEIFQFNDIDLEKDPEIVDNVSSNTFKKIKSQLKNINKLTFNPKENNVCTFLDDYEKCFEPDDEDRKKFKIIKFIPKDDQQLFNNLLHSLTFNQIKKKMVDLYITIFNNKRYFRLNIEFNENEIYDYCFKKFIMIKKYLNLNEQQSTNLVLCSLPPHISDLFYLNNMFRCQDDVLTYSKIIDHIKPNEQQEENSDKSVSSLINEPVSNIKEVYQLEKDNLNTLEDNIFNHYENNEEYKEEMLSSKEINLDKQLTESPIELRNTNNISQLELSNSITVTPTLSSELKKNNHEKQIKKKVVESSPDSPQLRKEITNNKQIKKKSKQNP